MTANLPNPPVAPRPTPSTQFYGWQGYRCAYEVWEGDAHQAPLVPIHPIGVGLSRRFWDRFCAGWPQSGAQNSIYNPDLLGCGESDMPIRYAYRPEDWADQLQEFFVKVVQRPAILVVQGALFPVAIELVQRPAAHDWVKGLVLAGPPAWPIMNSRWSSTQQQWAWNLLTSPLGHTFYRYARRPQFLQSFSERQLFEHPTDIDAEWLAMLKAGSQDMASRYAVFAFLAGLWRKNYAPAIAQIQQPTLVVMGETASSISRAGKSETPDDRMTDYLTALPNGEGITMTGRNVLPYEATDEFIRAIAPFVQRLS